MTEPSEADCKKAREIVLDYIKWNREGRPRPTHGFPPEYFADDLVEHIAMALCEARTNR